MLALQGTSAVATCLSLLPPSAAARRGVFVRPAHVHCHRPGTLRLLLSPAVPHPVWTTCPHVALLRSHASRTPCCPAPPPRVPGFWVNSTRQEQLRQRGSSGEVPQELRNTVFYHDHVRGSCMWLACCSALRAMCIMSHYGPARVHAACMHDPGHCITQHTAFSAQQLSVGSHGLACVAV
jgi:hypothetical protein